MTTRSRTQNDEALFNALLFLLRTKTIEQISITELCKAAAVSRMSYYRNYQSIEDIITAKLNDIFSHAMRFMSKYKLTTPAEFGQLFFSFFQDYTTDLRTLISSDLKFLVSYAFKDDIKILINHHLVQVSVPEDEYWLAFVASGLTESLFLWSLNGAVETPEQMGRIVSHIINHQR